MLRLRSPLGPPLSLPKAAPAPARRVRSGGAAATSLACAHLRPALPPLRSPASDPATLSNHCASFRPPTRLRPYPPPRFSRRPSPASAPRTSTSDRDHVPPVPRPQDPGPLLLGVPQERVRAKRHGTRLDTAGAYRHEREAGEQPRDLPRHRRRALLAVVARRRTSS